LLADEDTDSFKCLEKRQASPVCQSGDHDDTEMSHAVENISDCRYLLVSRIGYRARNECEKKGIAVYEIPDEIEKAVDRLLKYEKIQQLINVN
jgi:predicted Fe-Mo cluster-binding NifX family protein